MVNKMFSTGIILLLTITMAQAAYIDGLWQVNRSNDLVEIRSTEYGIKAKFLNANNWDRYERIKNDIYEDRKGNRYYVKTRDRITWESRDGRRVINLEKSRAQNRRQGRYDDYDYGYDRNNGYNNRSNRRRGSGNANQHYCTADCRNNCALGASYRDDGLSGRWTNRWRNTIAYVEFDGYNLRMKTNRSGRWTTYRRTNSRKLIFEDKWGNRLRFRNNGKLQWKRADGRRTIDFRRDF